MQSSKSLIISRIPKKTLGLRRLVLTLCAATDASQCVVLHTLTALLPCLYLEDKSLDDERDDNLKHNKSDDDEAHEVDSSKPVIGSNLGGKPLLQNFIKKIW